MYIKNFRIYIKIFRINKSQDFRIKQRLQAICDWVSIYNGHLRGPVTRTPIVERLAVELSLPVFTTYVCHGWDSNIHFSACEANALTD